MHNMGWILFFITCHLASVAVLRTPGLAVPSSSNWNDDEGPPRWSYRMTEINYLIRVVNSFLDLKCLAKGYPTPNITWFKDGHPFLQRKMGNFSMKGWRLTITNLMPEDEGNYTCFITNQFGSINWTFVVEIMQAGTLELIIEGPENQTVVVCDTAVLTCKIIFTDTPTHVLWVKHYQVNGSYKSPSGDPYLRVIQSATVNNSSIEQLILFNVLMEDAGRYTCRVANPMRMVNGSAWLTVVMDRESSLPPRTCVSLNNTSQRNNTSQGNNTSLGNARGFIYEDPRFIGGVAAIFIVVVVICLGVAFCCCNRQRRQRMFQPQKTPKRVMKPLMETGENPEVNEDHAPSETFASM